MHDEQPTPVDRPSPVDRKRAIQAYKETPRPAGVYRVRHRPSGRTMIGASPDAPAMLNRIRAQLRMSSHRNRALQADWDEDGADAFEFEVLDLLTASSEGGAYDPTDDLELLLGMWREKLKLSEQTAY